MRSVSLSDEARLDLLDADDYLGPISPAAAERMRLAVEAALEGIASGLIGGRKVRLDTGEEVHTWSVPPYSIYYRLLEDEVEVVRVYHHARRPITRED